jgi:hypothetical protein
MIMMTRPVVLRDDVDMSHLSLSVAARQHKHDQQTAAAIVAIALHVIFCKPQLHLMHCGLTQHRKNASCAETPEWARW